MWFILRIQVASRRDDISNMRWDEVIFEGICLGSLRVNFCAGSTSTRLKKRQAFLDCACVFYPSMLWMPWGRGWAMLFRSCFSKKKPKHQNPKQNKTRPHPTKTPTPNQKKPQPYRYDYPEKLSNCHAIQILQSELLQHLGFSLVSIHKHALKLQKMQGSRLLLYLMVSFQCGLWVKLHLQQTVYKAAIQWGHRHKVYTEPCLYYQNRG